MSLFARLLSWSIISIFLVVGLLAFSNSHHISNIAVQSTDQLLTSRLKAIETYFSDQYITNILDDLKLLSQAPSLNNLLASPEQEKKLHRVEVAKFFQRVVKTNTSYKKLEVFDTEGLQLLAISPTKRFYQYNNLNQLFTNNALQNEKAALFSSMCQDQHRQVLTSSPLPTDDGDTLLYAVMGLTDPDIGRFGGAIIVTVSLQKFFDRLNKLFKQASDSQTSMYIKLIDSQNNRTLINLQSHVSPIPGQEWLEPILNLLLNDIDLVAQGNLPLGPYQSHALQLEFGIPKEVIYNQVVKSLAPVFSAAGLVLLLSIAFSAFISRSIALPITALSKASGQLSQGNFSVTVSEEVQGSELKQLSRTFNKIGKSLQRYTKEISFLAFHDPLTRLPNRIKFIRHLNNMIADFNKIDSQGSASGFAVIFIDLDDFKGINDNFGHQVGDKLLCAVSHLITNNLRASDFIATSNELTCLPEKDREIVARIGGDEFLICLPNITQPEQASHVAERLLTALQQPIQVDKEELFIEASLGIVLYPQSGKSAEELIKFADIAMYAAKDEGKRTYSHFSPEMSLHLKNIADVERDLRKAQNNLDQFELLYQPFIEKGTGKIIGAEALLRWNHPSKGVISPHVFIGIAETTGLILPMGEWIINKVCQQLANWQGVTSPAFYVAVNLSAKQIHRQDVATILQEKIQQFSISPQQIHVEVTESLLMKDENKAKKTIDAIRDIGIQVWLDDFGTGYSSLSYLRKFQFDGVKIDRSFVRDIDDDAHDRALCTAIISMAKNMNMQVVAEGIETKTQAEFLIEKKCCIGQGYYYSKPISAEAFAASFFQRKKLA
ncbi:bifunctional diguanylate cyclase/phosphodiesterase [Spartinivicinus poritis]|uniref:EAL domain-containing protein n=1 Tax=Spartinivicinus poritis TaxID=2994640 RepID=A0ABT5UH02_9GAMM|nr:EAL domain-containing protein [Spartinivicinus sp. A2-2]MDE1465671.1 EAL domain-containing protein [Spartinivicinus sp. A2-2]